ncbi:MULTISPECIES: response regulator [Asticcacaulis]|uniref:response regulator n=1 Tax=Asticcacaulis TaxID=76890 RepID=UPI001AE264F9|nr:MULTISPECIES: response regulator [Asticcacaulis]MBP2161734.1 CheY-like chemotaxis protein [Asticcacaulis solisilvae]MDR6802754.1 CheY-like chemotaxis protein [Asticcacaulis sp. BE141]
MSSLLMHRNRPAEILLVEDNRGDVLLTRKAFQSAQIENRLSVAESGEAALERLRDEAQALPDLILLDLNLPRMSGRDVLGEIKVDARLRHIPVIILSSSAAEQDIARSYALHASAYIVKPVDLDSFRAAISTIEQFFFFLVELPEPAAAE